MAECDPFQNTSVNSLYNTLISKMTDIFCSDQIRCLMYGMDDIHTAFMYRDGQTERTRNILTGSYIEGCLNANDIDVMEEHSTIRLFDVTAGKYPTPGTTSGFDNYYIIASRDVYPGFFNIQTQPLLYADMNMMLDQDTIFQLFFPNRKYRREGPTVDLTSTERQAAADNDMVPCLKLDNWPTTTKDFFSRKRLFGWPSAETLQAIEAGGCHIVLKAHPQSRRPDKEVRLSSSVAETRLVRSFNTVQFKSYLLSKCVQPKVFPSHNSSQFGSLIPSYFIKTVMFWMCEIKPPEYWKEGNLVQIVEDVYTQLESYLQNKTCPNFFIPENLMMSHYSDSESEAAVQQILALKQSLRILLSQFYHNICVISLIPDFPVLPLPQPGQVSQQSEEDLKVYLQEPIKTIHEHTPRLEASVFKIIIEDRPNNFIGFLFSLAVKEYQDTPTSLPTDVSKWFKDFGKDVCQKYVAVTSLEQLLKRQLAMCHYIFSTLDGNDEMYHLKAAHDLMLASTLPEYLDESTESEKACFMLFHYLNGYYDKVLYMMELCKKEERKGSLHLTVSLTSYLHHALVTDPILYNYLVLKDVMCDPIILSAYMRIRSRQRLAQTRPQTPSSEDSTSPFCYLVDDKIKRMCHRFQGSQLEKDNIAFYIHLKTGVIITGALPHVVQYICDNQLCQANAGADDQ